MTKDTDTILPWKRYVVATVQLLVVFYIATFCLATYFVKGGASSLFFSILLVLLYLFVLFVCVRRLIKTFSVAALMIITPIAPLIALILIVTMLPILEKLH